MISLLYIIPWKLYGICQPQLGDCFYSYGYHDQKQKKQEVLYKLSAHGNKRSYC